MLHFEDVWRCHMCFKMEIVPKLRNAKTVGKKRFLYVISMFCKIHLESTPSDTS